MISAVHNNGNTIPVEALPPNMIAMMVTFIISMPFSPAFESPMTKAAIAINIQLTRLPLNNPSISCCYNNKYQQLKSLFVLVFLKEKNTGRKRCLPGLHNFKINIHEIIDKEIEIFSRSLMYNEIVSSSYSFESHV